MPFIWKYRKHFHFSRDCKLCCKITFGLLFWSRMAPRKFACCKLANKLFVRQTFWVAYISWLRSVVGTVLGTVLLHIYILILFDVCERVCICAMVASVFVWLSFWFFFLSIFLCSIWIRLLWTFSHNHNYYWRWCYIRILAMPWNSMQKPIGFNLSSFIIFSIAVNFVCFGAFYIFDLRHTWGGVCG